MLPTARAQSVVSSTIVPTEIFQRAILLDGKRPCCCHAQSSPRCSNRFASTKSSFLLVLLSRECHGGLTLGYRDETQCAGDRRCFCLCRRNPIGGLLSFLSAIRKNETRGLLNHDRAYVSVQNNNITKATPEPSCSGVFVFTAAHRALRKNGKSLRRVAHGGKRIVIQDRRQPFFGLLEGPGLPL